ncbi:C40 family peptidase [Isoptericola sp. 4D.3]|uniref:C40 family peptidase n=1 Tax=Isoptericola peretonis TaxID=2918523 RepID=A0ABT0J746_9MICO|nr:C40 family peptidase [Isoptericola sp. 4D.3]
MASPIPRGRHRATRAPITPLTSLTRAAGTSVSTVARRGALALAGSGVLVSTLGAPAGAETATDHGKALSAAGLDAITAQARQALTAAPAVAVPADAVLTVEKTAGGTITPAPEPEPEPAPEPEPEVAPGPETDANGQSAERSAAAPGPAEAGSSQEAAPDIPDAANGSAIVEIARQYLGVPYQWGGSTPSGFDCSGFTSYVYAEAGISIPRTSSGQRDAGTVVSREEAQPGDLIWSPGHIAIYAGGDMQVEAPVPGKTVRYRSIWQDNPTFLRMS